MEKRLDPPDYRGVLEKKVPIGSGEIEPAHRYIIQARPKVPGGWWLAENAAVMLALRVERANGKWDQCWKNVLKMVA